jgi:hypothetical protein
MGELTNVAFFVLSVLAGAALIFLYAGTAGVRAYIIRSAEFACYIFLIIGTILGGIGGGLFVTFSGGTFVFGPRVIYIGLMLGALLFIVIALPLVAFLILQIEIARNTRDALRKEENLEAR